MSLVNDIKNQVKKSGTNKGKFIYFKSGVKIRMRFLQDMEEGIKIPFHDSYELGINSPCQEVFERECAGCDNDNLRTRDQYLWSVWNYDAKEVQIFMAPVNSFSPIPALVGMYETYGTLIDRDYVITKSGSQTSTSYSVVPMDKVKFRNEKAKPFSKSKLMAMVDKAWPADEEDEDEKPKKKAKGKAKGKAEVDEKDWDEDMSAKELYDICVEKDIDVLKKKSAEYYIERLKDSEQEDDWDEDEQDDWDEDETPDYSEMSAKELYELCKERELDCKPKKKAEYYVDLLETYDENGEDSEDEDEDEDDWDE